LTSHKPRKQRKRLFNMPHHLRKAAMTIPLTESLVDRLKVKRIPVRRGDEVTIIKGDYKGVRGSVTRVNTEKRRLFIQGVTREKSDGTVVPIHISPSNLVITKLDTSDKRRTKARGG